MRKLNSPAIVALVFVLVCPSLGVAQTREQQLFLVFIDDLHLDFRSTPRLRELMRRVLRLLSQQGDRIALVTTGVSSVAVAPTSELRLITVGMSHITGDGLRADQAIDPERGAERSSRATTAIDTAREAIRALASNSNGPIVVLYFSGGYAELSAASKLAELVSDAYSVNATINTFEARSLVGGPSPPPSVGNESAWDAYYREARDRLRGLAESTGGRAVSTTREFDSALAQIARIANE
ncbi:MAG TPA: hypothetical protein VFB99_15125 [Vicinamibacterales bacterium]|nr:hypothetical protein [Vicinamibacterales bacterium]